MSNDNGSFEGLGAQQWPCIFILVINRRYRACEFVDLIHLDIKREADVVPHELKARMAVQVIDIVLGPGE